MAENRLSVIVFNKIPLPVVDSTSEDDFARKEITKNMESVIDSTLEDESDRDGVGNGDSVCNNGGTTIASENDESAQQQVSQNVNVAHDDNGGAIDGSNSYDLNSGTVEIDSNSDESSRWSYSPSENLIPSQSLASFVQFGQSNASLESMEQVVKWLDSLDENILHSAGDADTVDDTEMEIITATVNDCDTLVSDPQLNTGSSGQASTVQNEELTPLPEQTSDPESDRITADSLPQCTVVLVDCAKEAKRSFYCEVCNVSFMTKASLTQHIYGNQELQRYIQKVPCPGTLSCRLGADGLCEYRLWRPHWNQIQHGCRKCPKIYEDICSLVRHVRVSYVTSKPMREQLRKGCRS